MQIKNYNEIPSHPSQNNKHEKKQQQMLVRVWGWGEGCYIQVGGNVN
jgi:hypothetical protein